jgi:Domain of unknown function (DUF5666)
MTNTDNPNPPRSAAGRLVNRWNTPLRRAVALSALGVAAVTLAACGSSSSASTTSSTKAPTSAGSGRGSGTGSGGGGTRQFPGTSGTIAAINGPSLEVQNPTTGQTTVNYTSTTTFDQTVTTTASSVTVGSCISAFGKPTSSSSSSTSTFGRPVTATTVSVSQPTSGSCTGGLGGAGTGRPGGGGGFPGGQRPAGATGARRPFSGQFGAASGPVTAVNGSTVTLNETNPTTKKVSSVVVTLASSTAFTERQSAAATDLAVGKCANAVGTADTTGAVTARSITISTPGANGCTTGFGRFGGGARGPGGAGGPAPGGSTGA